MSGHCFINLTLKNTYEKNSPGQFFCNFSDNSNEFTKLHIKITTLLITFFGEFFRIIAFNCLLKNDLENCAHAVNILVLHGVVVTR